MQARMSTVAVVGGGINGVMSAWAIALRGLSVDLFERGELMRETSAASSKLLHGGIRYLEQANFRLVYEALHERQWWIKRVPSLARSLQIVLPTYEDNRRPEWQVWFGLWLYDLLAGNARLGPWQRLSSVEARKLCPDLNPKGLRGAFTFYDGQMDDRALGLWAAERAQDAGVRVHSHTPVDAVLPSGDIFVLGEKRHFDGVVNATGPWARHLLDSSRVSARHDLDLVRGSHLVLDAPCERGFLMQSPSDGRLCFILPFHGKTLVGTTEVRQRIDEPIECSEDERDYLLELYSHYFPSRPAQLAETFSGVRPLVSSNKDPNKATREYVLERNQNLITVFGGKWTTAHLLGIRVANAVSKL